MLPNGQTKEVVCHTSAEEEWAGEGDEWCRNGSRDLGEGVGDNTGVISRRSVVHQIEHSTASEPKICSEERGLTLRQR